MLDQMSQLTASGIPMVRALQTMAGKSAFAGQKKWAHQLLKPVEKGESLSLALQDHPGALRREHIAYLSAAENHAQLPLALGDCARELREETRIQKEWGWSLFYPWVLVHLAIILPNMFRLVTEGGSSFVNHVINQFLWFDGTLAVLLVAKWLLDQVPGVATLMDGAGLMIPGLGPGRARIQQARFIRSLSGLYSVGLGIPKAFQTSMLSLRNRYLLKAAQKGYRHLDGGSALGWVISSLPWVPPESEDIVLIHQESGSLDQGLLLVSTNLQQLGERGLARFRKIVPLLFYLAAAGFAAFTIIQFWQEYYTGTLDSLLDGTF